jgi:uncharacterized membrane protein
MIERDAALAVLGGALALAGVLLIFIGFILPKTEAYNERTADRFRWIARLGLFPFLAALFCAWVSIWAVQGGLWSGMHLWGVLKLTLVLTAIYAIISTVVSTS